MWQLIWNIAAYQATGVGDVQPSRRTAAPPPGFDTNRLWPSMAALRGSGRKNDSLTSCKKDSTFSLGTIETAQPPQPAPVRREPTAPAFLQPDRGDKKDDYSTQDCTLLPSPSGVLPLGGAPTIVMRLQTRACLKTFLSRGSRDSITARTAGCKGLRHQK